MNSDPDPAAHGPCDGFGAPAVHRDWYHHMKAAQLIQGMRFEPLVAWQREKILPV